MTEIPSIVHTLTHRQIEVAQFVAEGMSNKQIARRLGISSRRVHIHITAIAYLAQFDPQKNTRVQLALWWAAQRRGSSFGTVQSA